MIWTAGLVSYEDGFVAFISLGIAAYVHLILFVIGVALIVRYSRRVPVTLVTSEKGGVAVGSEAGRPAEYQEFIALIHQEIGRRGA